MVVSWKILRKESCLRVCRKALYLFLLWYNAWFARRMRPQSAATYKARGPWEWKFISLPSTKLKHHGKPMFAIVYQETRLTLFRCVSETKKVEAKNSPSTLDLGKALWLDWALFFCRAFFGGVSQVDGWWMLVICFMIFFACSNHITLGGCFAAQFL